MRKRPSAVTQLGLFVLIFTSWHLYRLIALSRDWGFLQALDLVTSPWALALEALVWAAVGSYMLWSMASARTRARLDLQVALAAYLIWGLGRQLWLSSQGLDSVNLPFKLGLSLAIGAWTVWTINRSSARDYFGELDERQQED